MAVSEYSSTADDRDKVLEAEGATGAPGASDEQEYPTMRKVIVIVALLSRPFSLSRSDMRAKYILSSATNPAYLQCFLQDRTIIALAIHISHFCLV